MCLHIDGCQRAAMKLVLSLHLRVGSGNQTQAPRFVLGAPLLSESSSWPKAMHLISKYCHPKMPFFMWIPIVLLKHVCQLCEHVSISNGLMLSLQPHEPFLQTRESTWASLPFQSCRAAHQLWSSRLGMYAFFQTAENWNWELPGLEQKNFWSREQNVWSGRRLNVTAGLVQSLWPKDHHEKVGLP